MLSITNQPALLDWAAVRVGGQPGMWGKDAEAMGVLERATGKVRAVMVINGFFADAAMVHFASDGTKSWATRNILGGLFGYMFIYKRLARVIGMTPATNVAALKMILMMGFRIEGQMRASAAGGDHDIVSTMFAAECRWILPDADREGEDHGQAVST